MPGLKGKILKDSNPNGIRDLIDMLEGLGHITLGVQGDEAEEIHPSARGLTVGQVAAIHELGLAPGVKRRSWLRAWIDKNEKTMVSEARVAVQAVLLGASRKKTFEALGYKWAQGIRDNIRLGGVKPPLEPSTIARTGRTEPLYDTHTLHNAVTYKLYLPQWKSVPTAIRRQVVGRK